MSQVNGHMVGNSTRVMSWSNVNMLFCSRHYALMMAALQPRDLHVFALAVVGLRVLGSSLAPRRLHSAWTMPRSCVLYACVSEPLCPTMGVVVSIVGSI